MVWSPYESEHSRVDWPARTGLLSPVNKRGVLFWCCTRTSTNCLQRVEKSHEQVHEHRQVEGDAAPEGHVPGAPVEDGLS